MIKLICPDCRSDEIHLKGDEKSTNNKDLFICECGNKVEIICPECGKFLCYECTNSGYYTSDFKYCNCGCPIEI